MWWVSVAKMARLNNPFCYFAFITLQISVTLALGRTAKAASRQYKEPCILYDASASCNSTSGLMCLDAGLKGYRCLCPANKLHAQLFDPKQNACVGKVFNACVPGNARNMPNETLCVEGAECNTEMYGLPICLCQANFAEQDDGTCAPSLKYGDSCSNSNSDSFQSRSDQNRRKCDEKNGQICGNSGKCECRYPTEQYYDHEEGKCLSYAGGRCTFDRQVYSCVAEARCPAPTIRIHTNPLLPPPFMGGPGPVDGDELFVMPMRPRLPPSPHRPHPPHHPHYPLLSKQDPLIEFDTRFDNFDFAARSIFFGSQGDTVNGGEFKGALDDSADQARCQCLPGFSRTAEGFCMKSYGSKCNPDDDTKTNGNSTGPRELCNPEQFLECLDAHDGSFMCQCRNPLNERYDITKGMCIAIIGRRCRPLGNYPKCNEQSECINGVCTCVNGTSITPLETCALDFNEKCEPGQCNTYKGLMCHGKSKTCMCLDSYLRYDHKTGSCVASKDSVCGSVGFAMASGNFSPGSVSIACEEGLVCKPKEVAGKQIISTCVQKVR